MKQKFEPKITVIGGGTGLSVLLRGLKKYTSNLTAIVSVTDDGGSSGTLRKELGVLPPGDIRNCLVALSKEESLMARLFKYRFPSAGSLSGHSFGNLFLTAMSSVSGSFDEGIARTSEVLAIRGKVLPATLRSVTLEARMSNGKLVKGESNITRSKARVKSLNMYPSSPPAAPNVLSAIKNSDAIVMGPGSLYTSIITNFLVGGITEEIIKADAKKIYVCNIMTQKNETMGYKLSDHVKALCNCLGKDTLEYVIVNNGRIPDNTLKRYKRENSFPVKIDVRSKGKMKVIAGDMLSHYEYAHHDSDKLAKNIIGIIKNNIRV
jgi:uncharacterized cofD-like protein